MWSHRSNLSDRVECAPGSPGGPAYVPFKPVEYVADGAIAVDAGFVVLTKGSAGAYTLAAPTSDQNGYELDITAGTAYAHVVTATGLIHDGVTGGAKNTWTSAAFVGSSATLRAWNGKWHLISKNLGTTA
jgi:hypothetical protein